MTIRCIMCGKIIEVEEFNPTDPYEDEEEERPRKKVLFCQFCEAKLKKEAEGQQKTPKPM